MCLKIIIILFTVGIVKYVEAISTYKCHAVTKLPQEELQDGRLGATGTFPWLGLLKVYIRDEGTTITALTGIVFVTNRHVLANADDVARMPLWMFRKRTEAMFIPKTGKTLNYNLVNYTLHPEYKRPSINTIALVTLAHDEQTKFPTPVCWNQAAYNNLEHLFVVGFTDEHELVEKFIHKAKHIDLDICNDFYIREDLNEVKRLPTHYLCISTVIKNKSCVWDNGMALISNSTGFWVLVGFGVYGPGCSVPARFIRFLSYKNWIQSIVDSQKSHRRGGERRQHINFQGYDLMRQYHANKYLFDTEKHSEGLQYTVERETPQSAIVSITTSHGKKIPHQALIYSEKTKIVASVDGEGFKSATYKLSLYDLFYSDVSCVHVSINAERYKNAYLYVEDAVYHSEGTALSDWDETPEELLRGYLLNAASGAQHRPSFIKKGFGIDRIENYNLYFKFQFEGEACFFIKVYGRTAKPKQMKTHALRKYHHDHLSFGIGNYKELAVRGFGTGYSTITLPISYKVPADIATISAASYTAFVVGIIQAETGIHIHGTSAHHAYYHPMIVNRVLAALRAYGRFNFNVYDIPNRLYWYAVNARARGRKIPTLTVKTTGSGYGTVGCALNNCAVLYRNWHNIPVSSSVSTQVTVKTRPTYTTVYAQTTTETTSKIFTNRFGEIDIPMITEFNHWCFFENFHKKSHCYYDDSGYNDNKLPRNLWSKTPPPSI